MDHAERNHDDDVAYAVAMAERIETELLAVLERYTRHEEANGAPRFGRYLALHAVADLAGRLMLAAIEVDGERGYRAAVGTVEHLQLLVVPAPTAHTH